jgi:hypothetical protein
MNSATIIRLARVTFGALVLFCVMTTLAHAGTATSITGLYTTGLDGNDAGSRDDHWKMSDGNYAYVVSNANVTSHGWQANTTSTKWISYASNGSTGLGSGTYTYTLTFNINGTGSGAVSGVSVYMALAVDDSAVITVNGGNPVNSTGGSQWASTQNVTLNNGFVIGSNTITITVSNSGAGASGVFVSSISGVVPEVGAWMPVAGALALFSWLRLRRKKKLPLAA